MSPLQWFSPLDMRPRHRDFQMSRITSIGSWLLELEEFVAWRDHNNSDKIFLLRGSDGSGKTMLTSLVVDHIQDTVDLEYSTSSDNRVGCFHVYCDYLKPHLQTPVNVLGSLLRQFYDGWPAKLEDIMQRLEIKTSKTTLTPELVVKLLNAVFRTLDRVFICLDGMDSWDQPNQRDFFQSLYEVLHGFRGRWRLFSTTNSWGDDLKECLGEKATRFTSFYVRNDDRAKCIKHWIENGRLPWETSEQFVDESISYHNKMFKRFLYGELHLQHILSEPTLFKRRRLLLSKDIPYGESILQYTLSKIKSRPNASLTVRILEAVYRRRILPFDEFQRLCEEANDSIPSPEDCDRQLKDKFLGLIAFGKASKSLMIVSHSVWKYLQQNEEFFSETIPAAPSQLTKRPPSIKDTSTYKNTSHRNTAQERYTYTPELDIDIDDDIDNLDDHDVNNDYPREDLAGPNARKRARIYDAAESQVSGLDVAKEALQEATILLQMFLSLYASSERRPWVTILLYGPPGTGKTLLAKAVATEARRTFFNVSAADILSKWHGETEMLIRQLFILARRRKPSVVFIDEIDALGTSRDTETHYWHMSAQTELFVQLDGLDSDNTDLLVVAATNVPWHLDSALRRRFHRRIHIPLPEPEARAKIFEQSLGRYASSVLDFDMLADLADGFSGSDISVAVQDMLRSPMRAILRAKHFKIHPDGKYEPCRAEEPGAIALSYREIPFDKIIEPPLQMTDVIMALKSARSSVDQAQLRDFEKWTDKFGIAG